MKCRGAYTFVKSHVAHLIVTRALQIVIATTEAIASGFITIGESTASNSVGAAVARVPAVTRLAHLAARARGEAIATKTGVALGIDAVECTSLEAGRAHTLVRVDVAKLVILDALLVVCASAQAITGDLVTIGKARAPNVISSAVAWIGTGTRFAHVAARTHGGAVTAVAGIDLRVDAFQFALGQGRLAIDATILVDRRVLPGPTVVRRDASIF